MTSSTRRAQWRIPAGLLLLSFVPVLAGVVRITSLTTGAEVTPENERFFDAPVPVVVHIVGAVVYCILGAFQFHPGFRRRRPGWHRAAGRILIPCGLAAALSGVWMALFYPDPEGGSDLLTAFRLLSGTTMAVAIVLAFAAIRRRNVPAHRAWMMRGYALGQGAGTQALLFGLWAVTFGSPLGQSGELTAALIHGAAWMLNLAVAEWCIRRQRPTRRTGRPAPQRIPPARTGWTT